MVDEHSKLIGQGWYALVIEQITIDDLFADLEEADPDDDDSITNWLGSLQTCGSAIGNVATTEQSARSGRNSTNTTVLNSFKTVLAAERSTAEKTADRLYRNTEQSAWNAYLTGVQSANTTYLGSHKTAENTYKTASDAADSAFDTTTITAYTNYHQTIHTLDTAFYAAVSEATDPTFTTTAYFTTTGANANLSYQKTTLANTQSKGGLWDSIQNGATWIYEVGSAAVVGAAQGAANGTAGLADHILIKPIRACSHNNYRKTVCQPMISV